MKKWIFIFPVVLLALVACAPAAEPNNEESVPISATEPPLAEVATELPPTAVSSSPTVVSESPTAVPTDVPPTEPTAIPTDQPVIEPLAPTEEPAPETAVIAGRIDEGAFFLGAPNAPVTMIDYSDFLWGSCRAYVLGTEPDIIRDYVETGQVKLVFWPVLNHGNPSVYSTLTAECAGQQDPALFWDVHELLFENQDELWGAGRGYFVETAVSAGADQATFEACYDSQSAMDQILELDNIRRQRGIFSQPQFDIGGTVFVGAQPYAAFAEAIDFNLE